MGGGEEAKEKEVLEKRNEEDEASFLAFRHERYLSEERG